MIIIPAVDIKDGIVLRLVKGDFNKKVFFEGYVDPRLTVEYLASKGFNLIHVVDLDAAEGVGDNLDIVRDIVELYDVRIQLGGGLRSIPKVKRVLDAGIYRVILGTLAVENPMAVKELVRLYGSDRIMVALDYGLDGYVVYRGWRDKSGYKVDDALEMFRRYGCRKFLLTSIERDGTLSGVDKTVLSDIDNLEGVYVAGGVRDIEDIIYLKDLGVEGVVIGRALYEGLIDLDELIRVMSDGFD